MPVTILAPGGTPLNRRASVEGRAVSVVGTHRRYFDLGAARRLRARLEELGITTVFAFHRDDMDLLAWVKTLTGPSLTLVYQQQMQLGVSRRDPVHAFRYSRYDAWIAPLEGLRAEVLLKTHIPERKIHVIPLGVDIDRFGEGGPDRTASRNFFGVPPGGTLFGILGRIEPGKGQAFLVRALKRVRELGHDARLLIVGDVTIEPGRPADPNNFREELRSLVQSLGLTGVVWLHPFVDDARIFFRAVDACVMATASETYGMVTLEAMASGTPVIGTASGGTTEMLGGGKFGMLFRPGDEGDFVRTAEVVARGEYPAEMVRAAWERVKSEFSNERECSMIADLIVKLRRPPQSTGA